MMKHYMFMRLTGLDKPLNILYHHLEAAHAFWCFARPQDFQLNCFVDISVFLFRLPSTFVHVYPTLYPFILMLVCGNDNHSTMKTNLTAIQIVQLLSTGQPTLILFTLNSLSVQAPRTTFLW